MTNIAVPAEEANPAAFNGVSSKGAVDFLFSLFSPGLVAVAAIVPDEPVTGQTFRLPEDVEQLKAWIDARQGHANLYYSLNEPKPAGQQLGRAGKLREDDVAKLRGVVVDLDPNDERPGTFESERFRLLSTADEWANHFFGAPNAIVDSGGGIQMVWMLETPLPNTVENRKRIKEQAKGMGLELGSDAVQSVEHLFRIPFTINLPNAKKRGRGRQASVASCLHIDVASLYSLETLSLVAPPYMSEPTAAVAQGEIDLEKVQGCSGYPEGLSDDLKREVERIRTEAPRLAQRLDEGSPEKGEGDRSAHDYAIAAGCAELGITDPTDLACIVAAYSPDKYEEKGAAYLARTVNRALSKALAGRASDRFSPIIDDETLSNHPEPGSSDDLVAMLVKVDGPINASAIPTREWLLHPRLPIGDVTECVGEPGVNKSTLALRDALLVASGEEALLQGAATRIERLHRTGPVIIYNAEDRTQDMRRRVAATMAHFGVIPKHPIYLWSGVDGKLGPLIIMERSGARERLKRASGADTLAAVVKKTGAILVILDPLRSLSRGTDGNNGDDMDEVLQLLARDAERLKANYEIVNHTSKSTRGNRGDIGAGSGSFVVVGKVRSQFTVCHVSGDEQKDLGLTPGKYVRLDYGKVSHGWKPDQPIVFQVVSAPVGNGKGFADGQSAGDFFDGDPEALLRAVGDDAPVLEVVDWKAAKGNADSVKAAKDSTRAQIAQVTLATMAGRENVPLADLWIELGDALRSKKLTRANRRPAIAELIVEAIGETGITIMHDGQSVRLTREKAGVGKKDPWMLSQTRTALSLLSEATNDKADKLEIIEENGKEGSLSPLVGFDKPDKLEKGQ